MSKHYITKVMIDRSTKSELHLISYDSIVLEYYGFIHLLIFSIQGNLCCCVIGSNHQI